MTRAFDPRPPLRQDCDEIFSPLTGAASTGSGFGWGGRRIGQGALLGVFRDGRLHRFGDGRGRQTHRFAFGRVAAIAGQQHPSPQSGHQDGQHPDRSRREGFVGAVSGRPENHRRARASLAPARRARSVRCDTAHCPSSCHRQAANGGCLLRRTALCGAQCSLRRISINPRTAAMVPSKCVNIGMHHAVRSGQGSRGWRCRHTAAKIHGAAVMLRPTHRAAPDGA